MPRSASTLKRVRILACLFLLSGCASHGPRAPDAGDATSSDGSDALADAQIDDAASMLDATDAVSPPDSGLADASVDGGTGEPPAPPPPWDGFTPTGPGYTVAVSPSAERGIWEGFGASLAWWAKGVGGSA